ncbi:CRISPR-associated endoribonuclease Cas6 [Merismopedia glauca]|uniref:CRISPR-associated endoribonuclease Cas6 n=1 Tax=Merismopedia glauca CCAP 1448/3 TaxID=1296344 RepID=A0A2T1BZU7_9CYAN|nr:CRISPR-associated endoribonuclease Cas6 [Merismopedia glauca]PSB01546.1 CRISPR-associated endoribonuclease Cas6 [Merismopedia glauca CCAP 1448/3]
MSKPRHPRLTTGWNNAELVGLVFELESPSEAYLYPQYAIGLHAWFLDRVRSQDPELSAYLHDGESEKPFTISGLAGNLIPVGKNLQLPANSTYRWYVTALSAQVTQFLAQWLKILPAEIPLRNAPLTIRSCQIAFPPTTYRQLFESEQRSTLQLSFISPTSFRRQGHHFPLPVPTNVFHSYLRRWNDFSAIPFDAEAFLAWIDKSVIIHRHRLESAKVQAGKKGSVTGFTGSIEYGLKPSETDNPDFIRLFGALGKLAPYCGTGHKTTFGLGQTRWGWLTPEPLPTRDLEDLLAQRMEQLTEIFIAQRIRQGGDRAAEIAQTWATILARREFGEALGAIALDLEMPYETVKTYAKLARRAMKN